MADPDTLMGGQDEPVLPGYVPPPGNWPDEANWTTPEYKSPIGESYRMEKWMRSEKNWKNRVGKGWVGKRVLGQGGFGVVGHWEYRGPDRDMKPLKDVAVKQAPVMRTDSSGRRTARGGGLNKEAQFLMLFAGRRTQHIVRMYRHLYQDQGTGPGSVFADPVGKVHRIFLEYCPGGDLEKYAKESYSNPDSRRLRKLTELELWEVFHCLSRAVLVMHQGSEDTSKSAVRWNQDEIFHCDLKLENVLVGARTTDAEHTDAPVFKIADFGISTFVPQIQDERFLRQRWGGTDIFNVPEQISDTDQNYNFSRPWHRGTKVKDRRFGTVSNVWQIGLIMNCLLNRRRWPDWNNTVAYNSVLSDFLKSKKLISRTVGSFEDLKEEEIYKAPRAEGAPKPTYSKTLRALIAETLLLNPLDRREIKSLVIATKAGLESTRAISGAQDTPMPDINSYDEPMLDPVWYSGQPEHPFFKAAQAEAERRAALKVASTTAPDVDAAEQARRAALAAGEPNPLGMNPVGNRTPQAPPLGQGGPEAIRNAMDQAARQPRGNDVPGKTLAAEIARNRLANENAQKKRALLEEAEKKKRAAAWLLSPASTQPIDVTFILERKPGLFGRRPTTENHRMVGLSPLTRVSEVRLLLARYWNIPARNLVIRGPGHDAQNIEYIGTVTISSKTIRCMELS